MRDNCFSFFPFSGRWGSGKTTLLNWLSGLERPTAGKCGIQPASVRCILREQGLARRQKTGKMEEESIPELRKAGGFHENRATPDRLSDRDASV
ncbi:ATP-binding cassette domain-containing protein [Brevibacillus gelatini]|uniref:ATP-binding cassette domain-containing protein n=1 Tax=Brevibacillus gelatini TaxID=1655277 RepID=A0A3M8AT08_9BACL|nr:ATP-binding cassette domain-containing protein [Brevibacillus gelatini]